MIKSNNVVKLPVQFLCVAEMSGREILINILIDVHRSRSNTVISQKNVLTPRIEYYTKVSQVTQEMMGLVERSLWITARSKGHKLR